MAKSLGHLKIGPSCKRGRESRTEVTEDTEDLLPIDQSFDAGIKRVLPIHGEQIKRHTRQILRVLRDLCVRISSF